MPSSPTNGGQNDSRYLDKNSLPSQGEYILTKNTSVASSRKAGLRALSPKPQLSTDLKTLDKDFKSGWFKKNANFIIDTFDNLLSDQSFSPTTVRVAILVMSNLHQICKA